MRYFKRLTAAVLVFCMIFVFAGCRYSDTLEQLVYRAVDEGFIDMTPPFEVAENDEENEDTNDVLPDVTVDEDSERQSEVEEAGIVSDTDNPDSESGYAAEYDSSGDDSVAASDSGTTTDASESAETASVTAGTEETDSGVDNETGDGGEDAVAGAVETDKQVTDDYGEDVVLSESGSIAAAGPIAVMLSVLGAGDTLMATDAKTASLAASNQVFSDMSGAAAVWSGDGSAGLDSDGLAQLIALQPEIVIETSGSTCLSDSDVAALKENGISYLVVPTLNSISNIETIMTTLGTVLGDRSAEGGGNAPEIAASYVSWVDNVVSVVGDATADTVMYTLYVKGWDDNCTYTLSNDSYTTLSGTGCAYIENKACLSTKIISSALSCANITNTANSYGVTKEVLYVTPLICSYSTMTVNGTVASKVNSSGQKYLEGSYSGTDIYGDTNTVGYALGTDNFPYLIAADAHTRDGILASKAEEYGLWTVYPHINNADGSFNSDGFLDPYGNLVQTQISGEYEVLVNPAGYQNWADGTCESILETVWAAWRISGVIEEDVMRGYISDFYSTFYGYNLSSAEIDAILAGN
ncbi:MAG: hypothetical protein LUG54_10575 [Clostridiales bacterium]|nr:hypothetical protein [Clostridiales bacterium]